MRSAVVAVARVCGDENRGRRRYGDEDCEGVSIVLAMR